MLAKEVKFKEHEIRYKGNIFKLLTPYHQLDELWVDPDTVDSFMYLDGNRIAFKYLYIATMIMASRRDIIIYFPIRKSKNADYWHKLQHYDLVMMNDQFGIKPADFKVIKSKIKNSRKVRFYDLPYNGLNDCMKLTNKNGKEYKYNNAPFEEIHGNTLFLRLPKFIYGSISCELNTYLHRNLEKDFYDYPWSRESDYKIANSNEWMGGNFYSKNKYYSYYIETGFHDIKLVKLLKKQAKEKMNVNTGQ